MRSHLLEGTVRHRRARPFTYALEHDVFYFALDLDELDEVAASLRLVGRNRRNVVTFRDADHLDPPAADLAATVRAHLRARGRSTCGLAHHARHEPARPRLRLQPGQLLPVPRPDGRAAGGHRRGPQHPWRATPVHAPRRGRRARRSWRRWTRRSTSRRSSRWRGRYTVRSETSRAAADHHQRGEGEGRSSSRRASTSPAAG